MTIKYLKPTQSQPEIWWACECKLNIKQYHGCFNISVFCCYYKVSSDKIQEFSYGAISCLFYCINLFITLEIHVNGWAEPTMCISYFRVYQINIIDISV